MRNIIERLKLDEKLQLLAGVSLSNTAEVERLGIKSLYFADGPHGVRTWEDGNSVCYPTSSAMAATWDTDLMKRVGVEIANECLEKNVDMLLGPGVNIKRTPLCGRNFEYYSEDPVLAGELAASFIEGVQSCGVGSCIKHFACNNQEIGARPGISSEVDIRTLYEIYLRPFEIAIKKAKPYAVMCAYNRLNGVFCSENKFLLEKVLREEWGFEGFVMSDWGAVHNRVNALLASLELEMPGPGAERVEQLKESLNNGEISQEDVDSALERMLPIFMKMANVKKGEVAGNVDDRRTLAKEAALGAITLLKNEDNILPIKKGRFKKIAVIGELANQPAIQGGGCANVPPMQVDIPLKFIEELAGNDFIIEYCQGYDTNAFEWNGTLYTEARQKAKEADLVIFFAGNPKNIERETFDRSDLKLQNPMYQTIEEVVMENPNVIIVIQAGAPVDLCRSADMAKGIIMQWFTGECGGSAIADIIFGKYNPSGRLPETFPIKLEDTPANPYYPGDGDKVWYGEGMMVGYRYYDYYKKETLFCFGHGLSYTSYEYSDINITPLEGIVDDVFKVQFKVKNSGEMQGKETVQLYVSYIKSKVIRPKKELKVFAKVDLMPGEEKKVEFKLSSRDFAYYNITKMDWHVEDGDFEILIGASSKDIRLKGKINIKNCKDYS